MYSIDQPGHQVPRDLLGDRPLLVKAHLGTSVAHPHCVAILRQKYQCGCTASGVRAQRPEPDRLHCGDDDELMLNVLRCHETY